MEDWAYAAGFDTGPDAVMSKCSPMTLPKLEDNYYES